MLLLRSTPSAHKKTTGETLRISPVVTCHLPHRPALPSRTFATSFQFSLKLNTKLSQVDLLRVDLMGLSGAGVGGSAGCGCASEGPLS
jgi:hypothetical protein